MQLADLFNETIWLDRDEIRENERTSTLVRVFGVRLHSKGLSLREVVAVSEILGVDRSHGAIWNWTHELAETQSDPTTPSLVAVDETLIEVDGEEKWLYAAIDRIRRTMDALLPRRRSTRQCPTSPSVRSMTTSRWLGDPASSGDDHLGVQASRPSRAPEKRPPGLRRASITEAAGETTTQVIDAAVPFVLERGVNLVADEGRVSVTRD